MGVTVDESRDDEGKGGGDRFAPPALSQDLGLGSQGHNGVAVDGQSAIGDDGVAVIHRQDHDRFGTDVQKRGLFADFFIKPLALGDVDHRSDACHAPGDHRDREENGAEFTVAVDEPEFVHRRSRRRFLPPEVKVKFHGLKVFLGNKFGPFPLSFNLFLAVARKFCKNGIDQLDREIHTAVPGAQKSEPVPSLTFLALVRYFSSDWATWSSAASRLACSSFSRSALEMTDGSRLRFPLST